jgi:hypothetical protein
MLLLLLHRVYERSKQSSGRNGKQRNLNGTASLKKLQVNLQVEGELLQDVDEVINGGLNLAHRNVIWDSWYFNQSPFYFSRCGEWKLRRLRVDTRGLCSTRVTAVNRRRSPNPRPLL